MKRRRLIPCDGDALFVPVQPVDMVSTNEILRRLTVGWVSSREHKGIVRDVGWAVEFFRVHRSESPCVVSVCACGVRKWDADACALPAKWIVDALAEHDVFGFGDRRVVEVRLSRALDGLAVSERIELLGDVVLPPTGYLVRLRR